MDRWQGVENLGENHPTKTLHGQSENVQNMNVLPAIQIGLLDFELFPGREEFYSSYMLMNTKTHELYSDKLRINVMELKKSQLATEEDRGWQLDKWARFFKSKTWEEIAMLAKDLPVLNEKIAAVKWNQPGTDLIRILNMNTLTIGQISKMYLHFGRAGCRMRNNGNDGRKLHI